MCSLGLQFLAGPPKKETAKKGKTQQEFNICQKLGSSQYGNDLTEAYKIMYGGEFFFSLSQNTNAQHLSPGSCNETGWKCRSPSSSTKASPSMTPTEEDASGSGWWGQSPYSHCSSSSHSLELEWRKGTDTAERRALARASGDSPAPIYMPLSAPSPASFFNPGEWEEQQARRGKWRQLIQWHVLGLPCLVVCSELEAPQDRDLSSHTPLQCHTPSVSPLQCHTLGAKQTHTAQCAD